MPNKNDQDVKYYIRQDGPENNNAVRITKIVNDNVHKPESVYNLINHNCPCWQGSKGKYCRHLQMLDIFLKTGSKPLIIDFDNKQGPQVSLLETGDLG